MSLKDRIGKGLTEYLYPYMQQHGGNNMPQKTLDYEEYKLKERYLWFLGEEDLLADFYQTCQPKYSLIDTRKSFYYSHVNQKIRVVHSGLPGLISNGKAELLLSGGVEATVDGEENEDLLNILQDNNFYNTILPESVVTESWGAKFAIKISYDPEVSEFPIMEKYTPFNYRTICKRDRVQAIVFINPYGEYELEETYGYGYVCYNLFRVTENGRHEVALTACPETAELENIEFDSNLILAVEKKIENSDYRGVIAEFDALDEAWSQLMDEIRTGRAETYVPEIRMVNKSFNDFRKTYVEVGNDMAEAAINQITHNQPNIRSEQYINSIVAIRNNILSNVKLNPLTIGIDDSVGANSSGEAIEKRETVSLRTRKAMINTWEPFLENLYETLLNAYYWINNIPHKEYDVNVTFGEYATPSIETKIANIVSLKNADIIDDEKALDEIYGDITEEEKDRILSNLGNITLGGTDV